MYVTARFPCPLLGYSSLGACRPQRRPPPLRKGKFRNIRASVSPADIRGGHVSFIRLQESPVAPLGSPSSVPRGFRSLPLLEAGKLKCIWASVSPGRSKEGHIRYIRLQEYLAAPLDGPALVHLGLRVPLCLLGKSSFAASASESLAAPWRSPVLVHTDL